MSVDLGSTITELIDKINSSSASIEITDKVEQGNASALTSNGAWEAFKVLATSMNPEDVNAILNYFFQHIVGDIEIFNFEYNNKFIEALEINDTRIWTMDLSRLVFFPLGDVAYAVAAKDGTVSGIIVIPSQYNGKLVTEIEEQGFEGIDGIMEIVLPDSLVTIGARAFASSQITSLTIPNSVTSIGADFLDGSKVENVIFDQSNSNLAEISNNCFHSATYLESIAIPDSVTRIGNYAFYQCPSLRKVTFGEQSQVVSIGESAFQQCYDLQRIDIPEGCMFINNKAFFRCYNLKEVTIPESVIKISYGLTFSGCHPDLEISVSPDNIYFRVEKGCLIENAGGTIIFGNGYSSIPSTASSIGEGAFYGNTFFAPIIIPPSITQISSAAFGGNPVTVYVEAESKPAGWADDWCDENVTVIWGYVEEDTDFYILTEDGERLTDEQGNALLIEGVDTSTFILTENGEFLTDEQGDILMIEGD